jgi:hypothetical protein
LTSKTASTLSVSPSGALLRMSPRVGSSSSKVGSFWSAGLGAWRVASLVSSSVRRP